MSLRIAFLNPTYWPEVERGSERMIDDLGRGLRARGHAPHLITSHPKRRDTTVEAGLPVQRVRRPPDGWLRRRRFDDFWTHLPFALLRLRGSDDDVVHAFYPTDGVAAGLWSRRAGRPSVFSIMGVPNPHLRIRLDAVPRAAARCSAVTVLSHAVARAVWSHYGIESRVIHPAVDLAVFAPGERAAEPTIFCAATPDVARKRVDLLVRAFARVRRERPDARLVLIRPASEQLARTLAAEPGVELTTPGTGDRLAALYASAWVTALPSIGEAFGIVLIESLAAGTPAVGTDIDAFPEIIDRDEVGRLFASGDEEDLARALLEGLELGADPATAQRCRARAADFSVERMAGAVEALYQELLAG